MTPRQWRTLATAVAARSVRCGPAPSLEARAVLQAYLSHFGAGEEAPSEAALAGELGIGPKRVRSAVGELWQCGFVLSLSRRGSKPQAVELAVERVRGWARGEYEVTPSEGDLSGQNGTTTGDLSGQNGSTNEALSGQNGRTPRARVPGSSFYEHSSGSVSGAESEAEGRGAMMPATASEAQSEHEAMLSVLRYWGFNVTSKGAKDLVWTWVGKWPAMRVAKAAEATVINSERKTLKYLTTVLANEDTMAGMASLEPSPAKVSNFGEYRDRRPWHFTPDETGGSK